ncbi:lipid asymmetry maintenance protein MlaB [Cupriavidus sp. AU9028]|uniref:STAS domain-containing protein n=1 Tax=Cupriavidus sp. AU9028 TaxID=2871157 RepID=UPI001C947D1F|nr:STAS domain-containing protein [Cupriavidus sp. AU9028]MBY4898322.1 STAS domain-containing protein [Cupriavidus sp. AU9028]
MISLGTELTNRNATAVLRGALDAVARGEARVDCGKLNRVDSSAVAVLLALHRAAQARGGRIGFVAVPAQLLSLAALYGVDGLLDLDATADQPRH